jgi:succinoglycan biosynthesis protein ExoV
MRLYYANKTRSYVPFGNFGDDLNDWVWQKFLPGFFEDDSSTVVFVGFGTILNERLPKFEKTIIFGTGYGYGEPPTIDDTWKVYCVRGPLTTEALKLPKSLAIADPAILVNRAYRPVESDKKYPVALIPFAWEMESTPDVFLEVCQRLGYFCIDPRWEVEKVLQAISQSQLVVTAAMHGAIVADALRVPWIPLKSNAGILDFKWMDFCQSLEMEYTINRFYRFDRMSQKSSLLQQLEIHRMTSYIKKLVRDAKPCLSQESILNNRLDRLEEQITQFKLDLEIGKFELNISI